MTIYLGNTKIKELYIGGTKIKEAYLGSTLVYKSSVYEPGEILFESSTAGASTLNILQDGVYQVICIGGGGAGTGRVLNNRYTNTGGASGSGFNIQFRLTKGNYSIKVGKGGTGSDSQGGNSTFGSCTSYGGPIGSKPTTPDAPTVNYTIVSTSLNTAGNAGSIYTGGINTPGAGGASVYNSKGYGGYGLYGSSQTGGVGYVKVVYVGQ